MALLAFVPAAVRAEIAGPPAPDQAEAPAIRAMRDYAVRVAPRTGARPCRRAAADEVVVCAATPGTTSPFRLPLPEERAERGERRVMAGEMPGAPPIGRLIAAPPAFGLRYTIRSQ